MKNWPLVWRSDYDEACAIIRTLERNVLEARAAADNALRQLERTTTLIERLADRLAPQVAVTTRNALPMAVPVRDEITEAIELSAGSDKALMRHLAKWAKQQKLDGMKEHDIIQSIIHWHNADVWSGDEADTPAFL